MDELFKYGDQKAGDFLHKEFWPAMHKNAQVMGTTYAIPFHNSTPIPLLQQDDVRSGRDQTAAADPGRPAGRCQKLTDESKGQWGIMLPSTNDDYGGWIFSALVRANGGKYFNEDYPGEVCYSSPTAIGALRFWQDPDLQGQGDAVRGLELEARSAPRSSPASSGWRCSAPARWALCARTAKILSLG